MADETPEAIDPRMTAAIDLLHRAGMKKFQIRYQDDEQPCVWIAVGFWPRENGTYVEAAGAVRPEVAVFRLCEIMLDGGTCVHCGRPTGFSEDFEQMPAGQHVCWHQWDPELKTFRAGCGGRAAKKRR